MKVVIAPDSFKESLSSLQVAEQIEAGIRDIFPAAETVKLPIADGGEGTIEALVAATGGRIVEADATGPLGQPVKAFFGVCGDDRTAVIEVAAASGLALVPQKQRNPLLTTSFGAGELIRSALDAGYRRLVIGIGGSATNDAGVGLLQALGIRFLDSQGEEVGFGGGTLSQLEKIDTAGLDPRLQDCRIEVACDVTNPLTGPIGAARIFGPQKGATSAMVVELDKALEHFAAVVKRDLGQDIEHRPGAGAAGGMGAGLMAFLSVELRPGVTIVIEHIGLDKALKGADLVVTGEGCIDGQSVYGKAPIGVAQVAHKQGVPVIAIAGGLGEGYEEVFKCGVSAVFSVVPGPCTLEMALESAAAYVRATARNVSATIKLSKKARFGT